MSDNQNDGLNKKVVTKARAKTVDKDLLNATRTKAKPDVPNDELIAKVTAIYFTFLLYIS